MIISRERARVFLRDPHLKILKKHIHTTMSKLPLKEVAVKYHRQLEVMVDDLAQKSTGGEEASFVFPMGKVTIKLK